MHNYIYPDLNKIMCMYGLYVQVVHVGETSAVLKVGDQVQVQVDYDRRAYVAPNHTMTHVLNYALRKVLLLNSKPNGSIHRLKIYFLFTHIHICMHT